MRGAHGRDGRSGEVRDIGDLDDGLVLLGGGGAAGVAQRVQVVLLAVGVRIEVLVLAGVECLDTAGTAADGGERAHRLDEVRVGKVSGHGVAGDEGGGGAGGLAQGPLGLVFAQARLPRDADGPGLALLAVGVPRGVSKRVAAGGKGGGEDLIDGELGRAVLADRVGLLGELRDARALHEHGVCEGLDAGFGDAHFLGKFGDGGASADAVLNLRRAHAQLLGGGTARRGADGRQPRGRGRCFRCRRCLRRGLLGRSLWLRCGRGAIVRLGGKRGANIRREGAEIEEELLSVFGAQHQRGLGRLVVDHE